MKYDRTYKAPEISHCEICNSAPQVLKDVVLDDGKTKGTRIRCNTCYIRRIKPGLGLEPSPHQVHEVDHQENKKAKEKWNAAQSFNLTCASPFDYAPWGLDFDCE